LIADDITLINHVKSMIPSQVQLKDIGQISSIWIRPNN